MEIVQKKILVPIGFSDQSIVALEEAIRYAKAMSAEISLLSIVEDSGLWARLFKSEVEEQEERLRKELSDQLEQTIAKYKSHGVKMTYLIARGTVYEEITRAAEMLDVDLVVMGTTGKPSNFKKKMIGSNAYRVVNNVKPPVITISGIRTPKEYKTMIFPLVLDRKSREKVGPALHYARLYNMEIKVVGVSRNDDEAKKLRTTLVQVLNFMTDAGVKCGGEIIPDDGSGITESLLEYAYRNNGDLMIIVEEGEGGGGLRLVSSDVERIIYNSEIPVMSVTPSHSKYESAFSNW